MSFNKVLILGNVGKDPEVRHLEGGASVANFTVATSEYYKDRNGQRQERTEWHNIVCWRQLADFADKYVKKGSQVFIEGKIRSREYTDQNNQRRFVFEIFADSLQLAGRKSDNQVSGAQGAPTQGSQPSYQPPVQTPPTPAQPDFPMQQDFPTGTDDFNDSATNDLPF